jgi:hypothetical protein
MDTEGLPETLLPIYKTARQDIPQDNDQLFPRVSCPPFYVETVNTARKNNAIQCDVYLLFISCREQYPCLKHKILLPGDGSLELTL